jgi:hypothetical protein
MVAEDNGNHIWYGFGKLMTTFAMKQAWILTDIARSSARMNGVHSFHSLNKNANAMA